MTETPIDHLVTIYGGSGFIGRHVVRAFAQHGWRIRVAVRRPDLAFHLQPLGRVGQIHAVQANLRYPDSVMRAAEGSKTVVNLVGILHESGQQTFDAVQASGAGAVAKAAAEAGAKLVHVSAIGADARSLSQYARTKAVGEKAALSAVPEAVIMRPSIVFGPEDDFFNRFASLARWLPALPLIGGGKTRFQPVFVGDVAAAIVSAVENRARASTTYELGGPEVKTFRELLEFILREIGRERLLVPLPFALARLQAFFLEFLPKPPLTRDQVLLLERDNVVSKAAERDNRTLKGLGIVPISLEAVVPSYLWRFRKAGQFSRSAT
ncbi:MAG TPA: complex I NDUFA9 subunit family protein [Xanthobacteraceae bacterium]|nr:complex I NDUFA9 subunit family protein [Xanthobacteraceae bacterium]